MPSTSGLSKVTLYKADSELKDVIFILSPLTTFVRGVIFAVLFEFEKVFILTFAVSLLPPTLCKSTQSPSRNPSSTKLLVAVSCVVLIVIVSEKATPNAAADISILIFAARASVVSETLPTLNSLFAMYICFPFEFPSTSKLSSSNSISTEPSVM